MLRLAARLTKKPPETHIVSGPQLIFIFNFIIGSCPFINKNYKMMFISRGKEKQGRSPLISNIQSTGPRKNEDGFEYWKNGDSLFNSLQQDHSARNHGRRRRIYFITYPACITVYPESLGLKDGHRVQLPAQSPWK